MKLMLKASQVEALFKEAIQAVFLECGVTNVDEVTIQKDGNVPGCLLVDAFRRNNDVSLADLIKVREKLEPRGLYVSFLRHRDGYRLCISMTSVPIANLGIELEVA